MILKLSTEAARQGFEESNYDIIKPVSVVGDDEVSLLSYSWRLCNISSTGHFCFSLAPWVFVNPFRSELQDIPFPLAIVYSVLAFHCVHCLVVD